MTSRKGSRKGSRKSSKKRGQKSSKQLSKKAENSRKDKPIGLNDKELPVSIELRNRAIKKRDKLVRKVKGDSIYDENAEYRVDEVTYMRNFGFTYLVYKVDKRTKEANDGPYRLKIEVDSNREKYKVFKILKTELLLLQVFQGKNQSEIKQFPRMTGHGIRPKRYKFLVTQRFGETVGAILARMANGFSKATAVRTSLQMLTALYDLHRLGYVHRFIRPDHFSVGHGNDSRTIYLVDFDLAAKYRESSGQLVPNGFDRTRGNIRYMPIASHRCMKISRRDDIESWLYMSLELFDKEVLPWHKTEDMREALAKKLDFFRKIDPNVFLRTAVQYRLIVDLLEALKYETEPNYGAIIMTLEEAVKALVPNPATPYDWENTTTFEQTKTLSPTNLRSTYQSQPSSCNTELTNPSSDNAFHSHISAPNESNEVGSDEEGSGQEEEE